MKKRVNIFNKETNEGMRVSRDLALELMSRNPENFHFISKGKMRSIIRKADQILRNRENVKIFGSKGGAITEHKQDRPNGLVKTIVNMCTYAFASRYFKNREFRYMSKKEILRRMEEKDYAVETGTRRALYNYGTSK